MLRDIIKVFVSENSAPIIELKYSTEFNFLCAVILSAQATDIQVNKACIFNSIKTPSDVVNLGLDGVMELCSSINYYRNKSKYIYNLAELLIAKHNSIIPKDMDSLCSLPGVGRKTANVFLNEISESPSIPVDTHVMRTANRLGLVNTKKTLEVEQGIMKLLQKHDIPIEQQRFFPRWLVLHGRYICKARAPQCQDCKITEHCKYFQDNNT